jgi:hypothetical protein
MLLNYFDYEKIIKKVIKKQIVKKEKKVVKPYPITNSDYVELGIKDSDGK